MVCPHVAGSHSSGTVDLVTIEEVLVEFLSAYAGRGAYLRQAALKTVRAILGASGKLTRVGNGGQPTHWKL